MESYMISIKSSLENFLKNPSKENVNKLKLILEKTDPNQIKILETYILAPLMIKLDQLPEEKTSDLKCEIINCIRYIIIKSSIKSINQFRTILIITLKQIYDSHSGLLHNNLSEEIKLSAILCITETFQNASTDILQNFYSTENSSLIGKVASACIDILQKDKYRALRISSIQCLQALFYVHNKADFYDIVLRNQVADSTFFFLPKIVVVLTEISLSEEKIGQSLIILSIQTLGRILHIIYEDKLKNESVQYSADDFMNLISENLNTKLEEDDNVIICNKMKNKSVEEKIKIIQDMSRNRKWFEATSKKLKPIFISLQTLQSSSDQKVKKEYTIFTTTLLRQCNCNLEENIPIFLESIIGLSQDPDCEIKIDCENILQNIKSNYNIMIKWDVLFNEHMTRLPRIINRNNEQEQIVEFLFLKGFFKFVPAEILCTIFSFTSNVEKFINNIIEALVFEYSKELLNEEYFVEPLLKNFDNMELLFEWKKFKNISCLEVEYLLTNICENIGMSSVNLTVFDHLMELQSKNLEISNEIILFLTFMLTIKNYIENKNKIEILLTELNDEKHWHLALFPDEVTNKNTETFCNWYVDRTPGLYESAYEVRTVGIDYSINGENHTIGDFVTKADAQFNVLHTCVVLNAIGNLALIMKRDFEKYIFKFLHRILFMSNNTNLVIRKAGLFALISIQNALNYSNISQLIQNYSDYLSYHINSSLKKRQGNVIGINIMAVMLQYSSLETFTYIETILNTMLDELEKTKETSATLAYLKVFNIFFIKLHNWINSIKSEFHKELEVSVTNYVEEHMITELKNALNEPINEINIEPNAKSEDDEEFVQHEKDISKEDEKSNLPNLPKHINTIKQMLNKILKFISSKEQMNKIVSLECMISGLPILKDYEDEILPLIHLLWYPYSERFKDEDPVVLHRCFDLLEVLADCSKNFLQKRVLKDVFPFLNKFLKSSLKNSAKNKNITSTQEHKLQIKLLRTYAKMIIQMDASQEYLERTTDIVILYLNVNQPQILQKSAFLYLIEISKYNKPLIYIKLLQYKKKSAFSENVKNFFETIHIKT